MLLNYNKCHGSFSTPIHASPLQPPSSGCNTRVKVSAHAARNQKPKVGQRKDSGKECRETQGQTQTLKIHLPDYASSRVLAAINVKVAVRSSCPKINLTGSSFCISAVEVPQTSRQGVFIYSRTQKIGIRLSSDRGSQKDWSPASYRRWSCRGVATIWFSASLIRIEPRPLGGSKNRSQILDSKTLMV